tara:strand:+ start:163 stop:453 length:291 start_codon:yes stop_codon:yes gene_type:complete
MGETYYGVHCPVCKKKTGWMCGSSGWGNNCSCDSCGVYFRHDGRAKKWPPVYMFHPPEERLGVILKEGVMGTLNHKDFRFWSERVITKLKQVEVGE